MVPNMAYHPPIMLGGVKDPIWDRKKKEKKKWYLELKKGTQKDPMEGHQKIPKRAVKDP